MAGPDSDAIEYDLVRATGCAFADVPERLSWNALAAFVRGLGPGSSWAERKDPEAAAWGTREKTNAILADIFDLLAIINRNLVAANTPKGKTRPKAPRPYPRPHARDAAPVVGRDPIPVGDFDEWWGG